MFIAYLNVFTGREYDKSGVLRPWWNEASIQRFKHQAKCIDDQYSAYSAFGQKVSVLYKNDTVTRL